MQMLNTVSQKWLDKLFLLYYEIITFFPCSKVSQMWENILLPDVFSSINFGSFKIKEKVKLTVKMIRKKHLNKKKSILLFTYCLSILFKTFYLVKHFNQINSSTKTEQQIFLYTRKLSYEHFTPAIWLKIIFVNSQRENTNSIGDFLLKNRF